MGVNERNRRWNRLLINYFWMALVFVIIVTIINMNLRSATNTSIIMNKIATPALIFLSVILFFEWSYRRKEKINDYVIIIGSIIILGTFILSYSVSISILIILFVYPIFFAVFTMKKRLITFAFISVMMTFWVLNMICPHFTYFVTEQITFTFVLISAYSLGIALVNHFKKISDQLVKSVKNEKELLFKKIYMERLTKIDLATNLYNHKTFHEYLEKVMEQFSRRPFPLHLALLDLDNFKQVNDRYGHAIGDCVIEKVAEIIQDNICEHDLASRYGGEEFAIIFIEKSQEECLDILNKIRASLEAHRFANTEDQVITLSIGLATEAGTLDKDQLFKMSDKYLYQSKTNGKNQITFGTSILVEE